MALNLLAFSDVMKTIGSVLLAILILLAMITVHEFGHYIAGKIFKFKSTNLRSGSDPRCTNARKRTEKCFRCVHCRSAAIARLKARTKKILIRTHSTTKSPGSGSSYCLRARL